MLAVVQALGGDSFGGRLLDIIKKRNPQIVYIYMNIHWLIIRGTNVIFEKGVWS